MADEKNYTTIFGNEIFYFRHLANLNTIFGTMFNNIRIVRESSNKKKSQLIKVPLYYSKKDKLISAVMQDKYKAKPVQHVFPILSFSRNNNITYNENRQLRTTNPIQKSGYTSTQPAPYDVGFELNIVSNNQEDVCMILEQILPFFQPDFIIKVDMLPASLGIKRDIVIRLEGINEDEEGVFGDMPSTMIYTTTLTFVIETYFYPPSKPYNQIKWVKTDLFDMWDTEKMATLSTRINPLSANEDDDYIIVNEKLDDKG